MNKQVIKLLVLVVVLAGVAVFYFWDDKNVETKEKKETEAKQLVNAKNDDVTGLTIMRTGKPNLTVTKSGEGDDAKWTVTEGDFTTAADKYAVDPMVGALVRAEKKGTIENATNTAVYDLSEPQMAIVVAASGISPVTIDLGSDAPGTSQIFSKIKGDDNVYRIDKTVKTAVDKTLFDLRDKTVAKVEPNDMQGVELVTDGEAIHIARDADNQWRFTEPITSLALKADVDSIIRKANNTKATEFIDDATDYEPYGLTESATRVTYFGKDEALRTILIGKKDELRGGYYVKRTGNPSIMVVPDDFVTNTVGKTLDDLRLKKFFTFMNYECEVMDATTNGGGYNLKKVDYKWHMTSPKDATCEQTVVNNLVRDVFNAEAYRMIDAVTDATVFGFENPVLTLTCANRDGVEQTVVFGNELPKEGNIFAKRLADNVVMVVGADVFDKIMVPPDSLLPEPEPTPVPASGDIDSGTEAKDLKMVPDDVLDGMMEKPAGATETTN